MEYNKENKCLMRWMIACIVLIFCAVFSACSDEDEADKAGTGFNAQNEKMVGSKWEMTNWDYGMGDDWVSTLDETYAFYFYSSTEGLFYYGRKDNDSDFGASSDRSVAHFTYNVSGEKITLDYITDPVFDGFNMLELHGNTLSVSGFEFTRAEMEASDKNWAASLQGTTGACKWYYNLKSVLWIVGDGEMADYSSYGDTPWAKNNCVANTVVIEDGVESVGSCAFANATVGEVELPSSLKKIGGYTFSGACISEVRLPDAVTTIGEGAFSGCTYLKKVFLPSEVEEIGATAFLDCKRVSLTGTKKLKRIGMWAFMGCEVTGWTDSEVLEEIGDAAFTDCDFSTLVLPNSLKKLGHLSFADNGISSIHIGTGLSTIVGTPFYVASRGTMYVDKNSPLALSYDIMDSENICKWTLHVPVGSKTAYSKSAYWKKFGSIVEDTNLKGDGSQVEDGGTEGETGIGDYKEQDEVDANDYRRGSVSSSFRGNGTLSSPYLISSAADLRLLSDECRAGNTFDGKYFKMTSDITINRNVLDFNGEPNDDSDFERWIPIGRNTSYKTYSFYGTFDGNGHTISGIYIDRPGMVYNGLFGVVTDATIKNLTLKDSYVSGGDCGGIVCQGISENSAVVITNCHNYATVKVEGSGTSGGIIAYSKSGDLSKISKCSNYGHIYSEDGYAGGVCGSLTLSGTVVDCVNYGLISGHFVGGVIARSNQSVRNCANYGEITSTFKGGGVCGFINSKKGIVTNCVNIGAVSAPTSEGAITGTVTNGASVTYNHYLSSSCSSATGTSDAGSVTKKGNNACSMSEMKSSEVLTQLNNRKVSGESQWVAGGDGYPALEWVK